MICASCEVFLLIPLLLINSVTTENSQCVALGIYYCIIVVSRGNLKATSVEMSAVVSWPDFSGDSCRVFYSSVFAVPVPCSISLLFFIVIIWCCCQAGSMFQPSSDFISDR